MESCIAERLSNLNNNSLWCITVISVMLSIFQHKIKNGEKFAFFYLYWYCRMPRKRGLHKKPLTAGRTRAPWPFSPLNNLHEFNPSTDNDWKWLRQGGPGTPQYPMGHKKILACPIWLSINWHNTFQIISQVYVLKCSNNSITLAELHGISW